MHKGGRSAPPKTAFVSKSREFPWAVCVWRLLLTMAASLTRLRKCWMYLRFSIKYITVCRIKLCNIRWNYFTLIIIEYNGFHDFHFFFQENIKFLCSTPNDISYHICNIFHGAQICTDVDVSFVELCFVCSRVKGHQLSSPWFVRRLSWIIPYLGCQQGWWNPRLSWTFNHIRKLFRSKQVSRAMKTSSSKYWFSNHNETVSKCLNYFYNWE